MKLENNIYTVFGRPGGGKTLFSVCFSSTYKLIYSNVEMFRYGEKINNTLETVEDIRDIKKDLNKGIILIDEAGLNINARKSMSLKNGIFGELLFLSRKLNCDIMIVGQLERSVDVYYRELSNKIFVISNFMENNTKIFDINIKKLNFETGKSEIVGYKQSNLIGILEENTLDYSTLESSKIT